MGSLWESLTGRESVRKKKVGWGYRTVAQISSMTITRPSPYYARAVAEIKEPASLRPPPASQPVRCQRDANSEFSRSRPVTARIATPTL